MVGREDGRGGEMVGQMREGKVRGDEGSVWKRANSGHESHIEMDSMD